MREFRPSSAFKKDMKRMKRQGKDLVLMKSIIKGLAAGEKLPAKNKDHPLQGNLANSREWHVQDDWLLIYEITCRFLNLVRTGSHAELYKR